MDESDVKISLCMIVRNCAKELDRCLASISDYVDEICLTYAGLEDDDGKNETLAVGRKYGAKISFFKWRNDFAAARNYNFSQASHDIVLWLDSDDTVENAASLVRAVKGAFAQGSDGVLVEYLYEFDKAGNCTTRLLRERFVDRRVWEWRAPIHECLCAVWNAALDTIPSHFGRIVHGKHREDMESTQDRLKRNIEIFEEAFKDGADARMLYYWGNTLLGLGRYREALEKYEEYLTRNGRPEERYSALISMSEAARLLMDQKKAMAYGMRAIEMFPNLPSGYLAVAEACLANQDWQKAISFSIETQQRFNGYLDEMVANPKALRGRPPFIMAYSFTQLGQYGEAVRHISEANKWYGDDENLKAINDIIKSIVSVSNLTRSYRFLKQRLIEEGHRDRLDHLREAVPDLIRDEPEVCRDTPKVRPSDRPTIAFVCPPGAELWGPDSRLNGGIGGSETAVIVMSEELAKLGWWVEVYAHTSYRGVKNGVMWRPFRSWGGENDAIDVVVFWRTPNGPRNFGVNARATYLWLHDIAIKSQWDMDTHLLYDGIMCLSKYHRSLFDWVPDEKIFMTTNALDPGLFVPLNCLENNPRRLVWGSCPSRGLQYLLPWWEYLRERLPDLELHVFYGFTATFMAHMRHSSDLRKIHEVITKFRDQPGVVWRGRVGQKELYEEYAKSGFWPYMTTFPEIQCITALEMQAHGVWPVAADHAALPEAIIQGDLIPGDMSRPENQKALVDALIERVNDPPSADVRRTLAEKTRSRTWEEVAKQWNNRFRKDLQCSEERRVVSMGSREKILSRV